MYPNLYYALKEIFGIELHWTKMFNSFGILLALSFAAAAVVLHKEFKRRRENGTFTAISETVLMGGPVDWKEYLVQAIIGFVIGYKIVGGAISGDLMNDAQSFIGSSKGNVFSGLALAAFFIYIRYNDYKKVQKKYPTPTKVVQQKWPEHRVGDFTIMAAVAGLLGAKLFHFFENWSSFVKDPIANLLSPSGLTFYGGLIVAAIVLLYYAKKVKINWKHLCDSVAPGLMIAYAIGRLGCQISGDGDWGIYNSAYVSTPDAKVVLATTTNNLDTAIAIDKRNAKINGVDTFHHFRYDITEFGAPIHKSFKAPSFLPTWAVAMNYAHNVNEEGWQIKGCDEKYCTMLPAPVFPTPLYEFIMCTILFLILWALRKKIKTPGILFGIYLMMNGAERFLIEKIRVNTLYHFGGLSFSQAELISTALFIGGIFVIWYSNKTKK
jgi:phosphatidylglycerol---prolipoprotein diacylglyceryl transferase